jgi:hypothetical protein
LTEQWIKPKTKEFNYHFNYGRRFIIQSSETIIKEYNEAKNQGSNNTILDKLLEEYLISQYHNNIPMLEEELKKSRVEPYIHNSISEINEIFGPSEANKKVLFQKFWPGANKDQSVEDLTNDFNQFVKDNTTDSTDKTQSEKILEAFTLISPLLGTKLFDDMTSEERREFFLSLAPTSPKPTAPL